MTDMKVSEVMTRTVECVTPDDTIQNAARKMRGLGKNKSRAASAQP